MRVIAKPLEGVLGGGIYYPINTDFSVWLEAARLFEAGDKISLMRALKLCYKGKYPADINEALSLLLEFFSEGVAKGNLKGEQLLSFFEDEELIYASFWAEYGIDLADTKLHWHRFLALLRNLGPDTPLMRVVAIRAAKPSDIKNSAERQRLVRKKRIFSLKKKNISEADVLSELFKIGGEADKCRK